MTTFLVTLAIVWAILLGVWTFLSRAAGKSDVAKIKNRLVATPSSGGEKAVKAKGILHKDQQVGTVITFLLKKYNLMPRLETLIERAGLKWHPVRVAYVCLSLFILSFFAAWNALPDKFRIAAWAVGLLIGSMPLLHILRKSRSRLRRFEEQFPDSLEFVARSMRAGHAFAASLEMIHHEFQEPLAGEFRRVFDEHNLGITLDVALQKLAKRIPSLDVHFFVSAVLLQKRTGGNLAEILDKLAYIIRERFKLRGRIRAISAHGRMTGTALTMIPVGVAVLMFFVNREYITFFFNDEIGNYMMGAAVGLQLIGYGVIQKIVKIEV